MLTELTWRTLAECRAENASYFFPPSHFERKDEKDAREGAARAICRRCQVREQCLEYALRVGESHGIWGGKNELERRLMQRRREREAAALEALSA